MTSWQNAGLPLAHLGEWTVHELNKHKDEPDVTVLDVRGDDEYKHGKVPGAKHIYVPHLEEHLGELDKNKAIATYCGSGYRASIAAAAREYKVLRWWKYGQPAIDRVKATIDVNPQSAGQVIQSMLNAHGTEVQVTLDVFPYGIPNPEGVHINVLLERNLPN